MWLPSCTIPGMADPAPSAPGSPSPAPYREVTAAAILFGILIGVVMNAAITYSGLKIGFTIGGSAIAAAKRFCLP